jgi:hypothetical protein
MRGRARAVLLGSCLSLGLCFWPRASGAEEHAYTSPWLAGTGTFRPGAETEATGFNLEGQRGSFVGVTPRLEYAPTETVSTRLRAPYYWLSLDGDPDTRHGIGDVELRLRLNVRRAEPVKVALGWDLQMPTGSKHEGLGEGAVQVTPWVTAGLRLGKAVVYLALADNVSLAGPHAERLPNYVDPSEDNELRTTLGTILPLGENVSGSVFLTETTLLTEAERGRSLLAGGLQLALEPDPRLRVLVIDQLPLAGEHRFEWKLGTAVVVSL